MAAQELNVDIEETGFGSRLVAKAQRNPFLFIGVVGCLGAVGVGAYKFKTRSKSTPMSLYFIQLRVVAQSIAIGSLTVGMAYNMLNDYVFTDKSKPKSRDN